MIFKHVNTQNALFRVVKCKYKAYKCKLKGLENDILVKKHVACKQRARKTSKKAFDKTLGSASNEVLLVESDDNYNKDELDIQDL